MFMKLSTLRCMLPSGVSRRSFPHSHEKTHPLGALAGSGLRTRGSLWVSFIQAPCPLHDEKVWFKKGALMTPITGFPFTAKPMETQNMGKRWVKLTVPSRGSTIHVGLSSTRKSRDAPAEYVSSPRKLTAWSELKPKKRIGGRGRISSTYLWLGYLFATDVRMKASTSAMENTSSASRNPRRKPDPRPHVHTCVCLGHQVDRVVLLREGLLLSSGSPSRLGRGHEQVSGLFAQLDSKAVDFAELGVADVRHVDLSCNNFLGRAERQKEV
ncbi:hypothetical protein Ct61P_10234 [Colletotrichum tofieldiae]|nr:hypothetical protein Ct61P_10234 [Colletotrichum tofieldiae]